MTNAFYLLKTCYFAAVVQVVATLKKPISAPNAQHAELIVVNKFKKLLTCRSDSKHKVSTQLSELMEQVSLNCRKKISYEVESRKTASYRLGKDINLVCMRLGDSIHSYFCCQTLDALDALLMDRKSLKIILECIFTCLYGLGEDDVEEVSIEEPRWDRVDYDRCRTYFDGKFTLTY